MDPSADLDILFADFGVPVTVLVAGSSVGEVTVLWEHPGRTASPYSGVIETTGPAALAKTADVIERGITHGAQIIHDDTAWYVIGLEPDGFGLTRLILSKDSDQ